MCRCSESELNCVNTNIRSMPEWIALLIGTCRSAGTCPAIGTAGFAAQRVNGSSRGTAATAEDDDDVGQSVVPTPRGVPPAMQRDASPRTVYI